MRRRLQVQLGFAVLAGRAAAGRVAVGTGLLLSIGALVAVPAQAIVTHTLSSSFGAGKFNFPVGIAVDNSSSGAPGEIYVADYYNDRVAKFKSNGTPDGQIDSSKITGAGCAGAQSFLSPAWVATDPSSGDLYVSDTGRVTVTAFAPDGTCLFQINSANSMPAGAAVEGVAIDPATGPNGADGTVYVANHGSGGSQIEEFDATTHAHTGSFPVASTSVLRSLALDPSGHLYVTDWRFPSRSLPPDHGVITEYDPLAGGTLLRTVDNTNAQAVAVDGADGHVFVEETGPDVADCQGGPGSGCEIYIEAHSAYSQLADFRSPGESVPALTFGRGDLPVGPGNAGGYGVAVNDSTNTVYLTDPGTYTVHVYGPSITVPDVTTGSATTPDHASAGLTGHVDPDTADAGTAIISCYFQYGTDTTYSGTDSGTVPCTPDPASNSPASNFVAPTDVTADLHGLQTLAFYHYRLVATSTNGVPTYGSDRIVRPLPDLPIIDSSSASEIGQSTATIESQINPGFGPTVFRVEYGVDSSYGAYTPVSFSIGSDGIDHDASVQLSELTPAQTYHYRIRAINFSGVSLGPDHTFTTIDAPAVSSTSSSSLTSASVSLSAQVNPNFSPTTYHFDYGFGTGYGSSTPESATIGSDFSVHPVGADLSGLVSSTTYHYRAVATNSAGTTDGPDRTFTTAAPAATTPPPITCKRGFVKRHGKCVRKPRRRRHKGGGRGA